MVTQLLLATLCLTLSGCSSLQYYAQSISGQWEVISSRQDIAKLLQHDDTPPALRDKLELAIQLREFAFTRLKLPDNGSYRSYVDLHRPYIVWNVFATEEFSLQPQLSCFLFVGCLSYRGFFSPDDAQQYADRLNSLGMDTYVGGVAAYSTLGWFNDPLLNTMLKWSNTRLAEVLFHELAHQKLYLADDTDFNEAFASLIGQYGVKLWLENTHDVEAQNQYAEMHKRDKAFVALLLRARQKLGPLYSSSLPASHKRREKEIFFRELREEYQLLKKDWKGYAGYDKWMEKDLNNAKLLSVSTYQALIPAFRYYLSQCQGVLDCFYDTVEQLSHLSRETRQDCLSLSKQSDYSQCPFPTSQRPST